MTIWQKDIVITDNLLLFWPITGSLLWCGDKCCGFDCCSSWWPILLVDWSFWCYCSCCLYHYQLVWNSSWKCRFISSIFLPNQFPLFYSILFSSHWVVEDYDPFDQKGLKWLPPRWDLGAQRYTTVPLKVKKMLFLIDLR